MQKTEIAWTDASWNPVRGCTKISPGCTHCYASTFAERWRGIKGHPYEHGFDLRLVPEKLGEPLKWKQPKKVFVNSMSDLFHEDVPDEFIDQVFAVMALCPQHTFQVLTKRPKRMAEWCAVRNRMLGIVAAADFMTKSHRLKPCWPLPNVWLGTSVESQRYADERIPHLLKCPASVRFLSCEPLLGPLDLSAIKLAVDLEVDALTGEHRQFCDEGIDHPSAEQFFDGGPRISWCIAGGESGPGCRRCDVAWIRSIVEQCKAASVPVFVKQLGGKPVGLRAWCDRCNYQSSTAMHGLDCDKTRILKDRKGGDMAEWPNDLQVREFPTAQYCAKPSSPAAAL